VAAAAERDAGGYAMSVTEANERRRPDSRPDVFRTPTGFVVSAGVWSFVYAWNNPQEAVLLFDNQPLWFGGEVEYLRQLAFDLERLADLLAKQPKT
jgi:hypothetical protein